MVLFFLFTEKSKFTPTGRANAKNPKLFQRQAYTTGVVLFITTTKNLNFFMKNRHTAQFPHTSQPNSRRAANVVPVFRQWVAEVPAQLLADCLAPGGDRQRHSPTQDAKDWDAATDAGSKGKNGIMSSPTTLSEKLFDQACLKQPV